MENQSLNVKVGLISLGCPKNSIDSEIMLGLLEKAGFEITSQQEDAQIIIINTCSFIEPAKIESIDTILEIAELKKQNTALRSIIVTGCLAQRYQKKLKKEIPEIDFLLGLNHIPDIVKFSKKSISKSKNFKTDNSGINPSSWTLSRKTSFYKYNMPRKLITPESTAYVKISDGCNNRCSYCTIPSIRGPFRSRGIASIINEVTLLAEKGVKEVNLIGQDTTNYGKDLKGSFNFKTLLKKLTKINGIKWLRVLYTYPSKIDSELIELIRSEEKICNYLDIPIQHIDDEILKKMERRYSAAYIYKLIENIRKVAPHTSLRTSVITGFPGETDKHFERLCNFIKEARFNHLGAFSYSKEEGTKAFALKGQIPEKIKIERAQEIMKIQKEISFKKNKELIRTRQKVLVEGLSKETDLLLEGRTEGQAPDVDGVTYINKGNPKIGEIFNVLITNALGYDLVGKII